MGFKEGIFVLVFIAIAAPFAFRITSQIPGFKDEAILGVVFLFYAIDAFMSRSGDFLPGTAVQSIAGIRRASMETSALKSRIASTVPHSPRTPSTTKGPYRAGSFSFKNLLRK